jgi:aerobic-type carbon monoxide dehydrogenase small subunit (CoxS/CutS family)
MNGNLCRCGTYLPSYRVIENVSAPDDTTVVFKL